MVAHEKMKLNCNFNATKWLIFWSKIDRVHSNQLNTQRCTMLNDWLTMPRFIAVRKNSTRAKTQSAIKKKRQLTNKINATIYRRPKGTTINRGSNQTTINQSDEAGQNLTGNQIPCRILWTTGWPILNWEYLYKTRVQVIRRECWLMLSL